jgi:hypothetical protein
MLPRLALKAWAQTIPLPQALRKARTTGMHHHTWLVSYFLLLQSIPLYKYTTIYQSLHYWIFIFWVLALVTKAAMKFCYVYVF